MKILILVLSIIAFIISLIWAYNTNYSYEPVIGVFLGLAGILNFIFEPFKKFQASRNNIVVKPKSTNNQNVEVVVNIDKKVEEAPSNESNNKNVRLERDAIIDSMKPKLGILFIDDDKKFKVVEILKDSGWKRTKTIIDVKSLDEKIVRESDILFVDINGVGLKLDCKHEGLDLALMLKQKYPDKKVVIYSASKTNNSFHEAWDKCDFKLEKNALPYQFQSLVENYSVELYS